MSNKLTVEQFAEGEVDSEFPPLTEEMKHILIGRLALIDEAIRRSSPEARVKEARKLGYPIVVHSASGTTEQVR